MVFCCITCIFNVQHFILFVVKVKTKRDPFFSLVLQTVDEQQQQQPPGVDQELLPAGPGHQAGQPGEGGGGAAHTAATGGESVTVPV